MFPGACRIIGNEYLHTMSVDIGEYIEFPLVIADAGSPDSLSVGFFTVRKPEFVSHIQLVESVTKELPVDKVFGM